MELLYPRIISKALKVAKEEGEWSLPETNPAIARLSYIGYLQDALAIMSEESEALFVCACLLHGNWPKGETFDVAFLPGLAVDNWQETEEDDGILTTAAALYANGTQCIAIPGNAGTFPHGPGGPPSETGYPGGSAWKAELLRLGVSEERVCLYAESNVGPDGKSWNTRTEIDDFVRIAREKRWTRTVVVASPFHCLRVMLTLVQALRNAHYALSLYPITPRSVSWKKPVYHSQGLQQLPRYAHIAEEWSRIPQYQENGSLCSFQELREYLVGLHKETKKRE